MFGKKDTAPKLDVARSLKDVKWLSDRFAGIISLAEHLNETQARLNSRDGLEKEIKALEDQLLKDRAKRAVDKRAEEARILKYGDELAELHRQKEEAKKDLATEMARLDQVKENVDKANRRMDEEFASRREAVMKEVEEYGKSLRAQLADTEKKLKEAQREYETFMKRFQ